MTKENDLLSEAQKMIEAGASLAEVGARLDLSLDQLKKLKKRKPSQVIPLSPHEKEVVIKLHKRGLSRKEIAQMLCITETQVKSALTRPIEIDPEIAKLWQLPEHFKERSLFVMITIGLFPLSSAEDLNLFFFKSNPTDTSSIKRHLKYLESNGMVRYIMMDGRKKYLCTGRGVLSLTKISCTRCPKEVSTESFRSLMTRIINHISFLLEIGK
ncbi:MAG: hypothetical protein KatS3mg105_5041 [Gemmatales bacterium]|nr:MAG: hypothetical protein KatS3mg105_5041 [Gemmatales bacterium]